MAQSIMFAISGRFWTDAKHMTNELSQARAPGISSFPWSSKHLGKAAITAITANVNP